MDRTYRKFLRSGMDLSCLGVERRDDNTPYFCTPKGASVFGWAGMDGIHFCFIRGFGDTVFAVSPENHAPDYVHPVAKDFADFLRLLLACKDAAAAEQAWMWSETEFEAFVKDVPPSEEQREVLSEIAEKTGLAPMERPWAYIRRLQEAFDYTGLRYSEELCGYGMDPAEKPAPPEWKVFFEGGFFGRCGRERAGTETAIRREFDWAGCRWSVPAAYSCAKGIVIDFCMRIETADIRRFMEKWDLGAGKDPYECFMQEQILQMESENPLAPDFWPVLRVNGKTAEASQGSTVCFNPCTDGNEEQGPEAEWVMSRYGLDPSCGWVIFRNAFPWPGRRRLEIETLAVSMEQRERLVPGPHFTAGAEGDTFSFKGPDGGTEYTLTVRKLEPRTLGAECLGQDGKGFPSHCIAMEYSVSPELEGSVTVCDCGESGRMYAAAGFDGNAASETAAVSGFIGGADGPSAAVVRSCEENGVKTAYSALRFEPVTESVDWRITFAVKPCDNAEFTLI